MGVYGAFESCESVLVVCEYKGRVNVYGDELKEGECGCRKELCVESRREESIR